MTTTNETTTTESITETTNAPTAEMHDAVPGEASESARVESDGETREQSDPRVERTVEAAGRIVEAAVDIGRAWAAYGLRVGKLALETHAHTMGKLASALGEIDRTIESRGEAAPPANDATPAS
jgi:hypothetical protein